MTAKSPANACKDERSGRQNIAEGNRAGAVSSTSELKLTNVARASLEELLLDFEDYLRHNDLPLWQPDSPEAKKVRALGWSGRRDPSDFFSILALRGSLLCFIFFLFNFCDQSRIIS